MAKKTKKFAEFIKEAAEWDNPKKKKIDGSFVSFDDEEAYEPEYFLTTVLPTIKKETGRNVSKEELMAVLKDCKGKVANNNPRKALLAQVFKHYDIDLED